MKYDNRRRSHPDQPFSRDSKDREAGQEIGSLEQ